MGGIQKQPYMQEEVSRLRAKPRRRGELFRTQTKTPHAYSCDRQCIPAARTPARHLMHGSRKYLPQMPSRGRPATKRLRERCLKDRYLETRKRSRGTLGSTPRGRECKGSQ